MIEQEHLLQRFFDKSFGFGSNDSQSVSQHLRSVDCREFCRTGPLPDTVVGSLQATHTAVKRTNKSHARGGCCCRIPPARWRSSINCLVPAQEQTRHKYMTQQRRMPRCLPFDNWCGRVRRTQHNNHVPGRDTSITPCLHLKYGC
jgi:hypothetical protein